MRALELRKAGGSYRQIAKALAIDTHTAWADVAAELADIRDQTVEQAHELRALELERLDGMTSGLWPRIQEGSAAAVSAGVRVSERRSRLLGLDEPTATRTELTGSLGIYAERLAAERELFIKLDISELEELAAQSQALVDRAIAMARAHPAARFTDRSVSSWRAGGRRGHRCACRNASRDRGGRRRLGEHFASGRALLDEIGFLVMDRPPPAVAFDPHGRRERCWCKWLVSERTFACAGVYNQCRLVVEPLDVRVDDGEF